MVSFIIMDVDHSCQYLYDIAKRILTWAPVGSEAILVGSEDKLIDAPPPDARIKFISKPANKGRLAGWYIGVHASTGDMLCLLHGDCELTAAAFNKMQEKLTESERIGAVAPRTGNAYMFASQKSDADLSDGVQDFPQIQGGVTNAVLFLQEFCLLLPRDIMLKAVENLENKVYRSSCYASILLSWGIAAQGRFLAVADIVVEHYITGSEDSVQFFKEDEGKFVAEYQTHWLYSSNIRRDILAMMAPKHPEITVLDIGCAYGGNLMLIGSYLPQAQLYGLDIDERSVQIASAYGTVLCADIEKLEKNEWQRKFDYILIGDCLEHLRDPWQTLKKIGSYLKPTGEVIISLPNVNHISVLRGLLEGKFQYVPAGILDRTHLRFFTKDSIGELLMAAELTGISGQIRAAKLSKEEEDLYNKLKKYKIADKHLEEFIAYQYVFKARPRLLTSIIILNKDLLSYTKMLIESIRRYTEAGSYELIVVDNGSHDGSIEWLKEQPDVQLIANKENVGFPKGCNQGLEIAQGQEIMFLNNDVVVTTNWLTNLRQALYSAPAVGAVGPVTNACSNLQKIDVPYENTVHSMEKMQNFAIEYNKSNPQKWHKWMMLVGFCLLFKREVYEKIGGMDEAYSPGNYEDDDFCLRIRKAGYEILVCKDTFIHHFGNRTFAVLEEEWINAYKNHLLKNRAYFCQKWGLQDESYHNYSTFLLDMEFADEPLRIIEYNTGSTMDLYILGSLCPRGEITGTTDNMADLKIGSSYPLVYVPEFAAFPTVLTGEYNLIIIAEDINKYGTDGINMIDRLEKYLAVGGWLVTVKNGQLLRMQKE